MSGQHSLQPYPETQFAPTDRKLEVSAQRTPRQNGLLAALPLDDYGRLLPYLEPLPLPLGWTVHNAGSPEMCLYFLTEGVVARFCVTESGASSECSVTGREGVIGVASFLGGGSTPCGAVVLSAGYAYRLGADPLKNEFEHGGALQHLLLRYTQALITQTAQIAACNRHHSLEQHLCRSILSILDRSPANELTITHERMADMLGVRREGVTEAAGKLQRAGVIQCRRGHIAVLDRARMEAQVCECYSAVKREYDRLLPNFGIAKSPPGDAFTALRR